jgi:hypothetical protein
VDQPPDKLGLPKGMPPITPAATRSQTGMMQGRHSGLEARIIAAALRIVVAALSMLALRCPKALLRLGQTNGQWVNHGDGNIPHVSAQRKEGPSPLVMEAQKRRKRLKKSSGPPSS